MAALLDTDVLADLADVLKQAAADLPDHWGRIVPRAHASAVQEIYGRLLNRGFTAAQVDAWDRVEEFERDLSLYWCLVRGGAYGQIDEAALKALDRRKELDAVLLFINGVWVKPTGDQPGLVSTSGPSLDGGVFNYPDPEAPGFGEYTKW